MFKRKLKKKIFQQSKYFFFFIFFLLISSIGVFLWEFYQSQRSSFISPISVPGGNFNIDKKQQLRSLLSKNNIPFSRIDSASDSSFLVELQNGGKILFSSSLPTNQELSSLQLILSRLTIEGKRLNLLDFRFDKPVITFTE